MRKMIPVRSSYLNGCDAAFVKGQYWSSGWILSNNSCTNTRSPTVYGLLCTLETCGSFSFVMTKGFLHHIVLMFSVVTWLKIYKQRPGFVGTNMTPNDSDSPPTTTTTSWWNLFNQNGIFCVLCSEKHHSAHFAACCQKELCFHPSWYLIQLIWHLNFWLNRQKKRICLWRHLRVKKHVCLLLWQPHYC